MTGFNLYVLESTDSFCTISKKANRLWAGSYIVPKRLARGKKPSIQLPRSSWRHAPGGGEKGEGAEEEKELRETQAADVDDRFEFRCP